MRLERCIPDVLIISSKIRSGWCTQPLSPGSFELHFHIQIKTVFVNPKNLWCFSGVDRTRMGLVGLKHIFF